MPVEDENEPEPEGDATWLSRDKIMNVGDEDEAACPEIEISCTLIC